jgi:protein involved in polysaccharide export with SLBB domain
MSSDSQLQNSTTSRRAVIFIAFILLGYGCGTPINVKPITSDDILLLQSAGNHADEKYVILAGDTLQIRYVYQAEMNQEVVVQPDGNITATLIGQIPAANMTTAELERVLAERTSDRLRNPEVAVSILRFADRNVYVGGEVAKPGLVRYRKGLTPLQAIIASGGLLESARADSVILVRAGESNSEFVSRKLDLTGTMVGGVKEPVWLAPQDIVYVPRSSIAEANLWMKQYVMDLLPFMRGNAGVTYRAGGQ